MSAAVVAIDGPLGTVLRSLRGVKKAGKGWVARCPAHNDGRPSLLVNEGDHGNVLVHCYAGCQFDDIVAACGLTREDFFPARDESAPASHAVHPRGYQIGQPYAVSAPSSPKVEPPPRREPTEADIVQAYSYVDEQSVTLYQNVRYLVNGGKEFRQRRPDGDGGWINALGREEDGGVRRVLYRLPEVIEEVGLGKLIVFVEGEKDVETLRALGMCATTSGGATSWRGNMASALAGADVVILPDSDRPGHRYAQAVERDLLRAGCKVRVVELPGLEFREKHGEDVSDWLNVHGHTVAELRRLIEPPRKVFTLAELLADPAVMTPPVAVVPGIAWAGRSTLLTGREKMSGKSTLAGAIVAAVSRGGAWLDSTTVRSRVLWVSLEEDRGDVARRLAAFRADETMVSCSFDLGAPEQRLAGLRERLELTGAGLVILDSLMQYASGVVEDMNSDSQTAPVVQGLTNLAHETGVAIVVIHHASKTGGSRGSTAIAGGVDVTVDLASADEDVDLTLRTLTPRGRAPGLRQTVVRYFDELSVNGPLYRLADRPTTIEERILGFLGSHPGASKERVREAVKGRAVTVDGALLKLIELGQVEQEYTPRGQLYRLNWRGPSNA